MCRKRFVSCDQIIAIPDSLPAACPNGKRCGWRPCEAVTSGNKVYPASRAKQESRCTEDGPPLIEMKPCYECTKSRVVVKMPEKITNGANPVHMLDHPTKLWMNLWLNDTKSFLEGRKKKGRPSSWSSQSKSGILSDASGRLVVPPTDGTTSVVSPSYDTPAQSPFQQSFTLSRNPSQTIWLESPSSHTAASGTSIIPAWSGLVKPCLLDQLPPSPTQVLPRRPSAYDSISIQSSPTGVAHFMPSNLSLNAPNQNSPSVIKSEQSVKQQLPSNDWFQSFPAWRANPTGGAKSQTQLDCIETYPIERSNANIRSSLTRTAGMYEEQVQHQRLQNYPRQLLSYSPAALRLINSDVPHFQDEQDDQDEVADGHQAIGSIDTQIGDYNFTAHEAHERAGCFVTFLGQYDIASSPQHPDYPTPRA